jgi:hypothetical protein
MMPDVLERLGAARPEIADRCVDVLNHRERADLLAKIVESSPSPQPPYVGSATAIGIHRRSPRISVKVPTVVVCVVLLAVVLGFGAFHLGKRASLTPATHASTTVPAGDVAVPDVVGQMLPPALAMLGNADLRYRFTSVPSNQLNGTVVSESPAPGTEVSQATIIVMEVAGGNSVSSGGTTIVPNVVGGPLLQAYAALAAADLKATTPVPTGGSSPPGNVTSQTPGAGSKVAVGTTVILDATSY